MNILEYQKKLEKSGIKTKLVLIKNVIHSFFSLPGEMCLIIKWNRIICLHLLGIYEQACGQTIEAVKEFMDSL